MACRWAEGQPWQIASLESATAAADSGVPPTHAACGGTLGARPGYLCSLRLCEEGQDELPLGSQDFLSQWLQHKARRLARLCEKLSFLPDVLGAQDPGVQIAWKLLTTLLPPRLQHIWRTLPWHHETAFLEPLTEALRSALVRVLKVSGFEATQWNVAELPGGLGGLGVPSLPLEAAVARCGALLTLPRLPATMPAIQRWIDTDKEALYATLEPLLPVDPRQLLGDFHTPPEGRSLQRIAKAVRSQTFPKLSTIAQPS